MSKAKVLKHVKTAYCCQCYSPIGFVVWPGKVNPRGSERAAIGFGSTASLAWKNAEKNIRTPHKKEEK